MTSQSTSERPRKRWPILKLALRKPTVMPRSSPRRLATLPAPRECRRLHATAGLSRESLYKALSGERSPGFDTILKVIAALGLKLRAEAGHC